MTAATDLLAKDMIGSGMTPLQASTLTAWLAANMEPADSQLEDLAANLTSTAQELNTLHSVAATVTWAVTAGAANVCIGTFTVKNAAGVTVTGIHAFDVYISTSATGANVSATSYSTGASVTTGAAIATITANKVFKVVTDANGVGSISITATGKPATEYFCLVNPRSMTPVVSAASGTSWGA